MEKGKHKLSAVENKTLHLLPHVIRVINMSRLNSVNSNHFTANPSVELASTALARV